jgi:hypothetical protein
VHLLFGLHKETKRQSTIPHTNETKKKKKKKKERKKKMWKEKDPRNNKQQAYSWRSLRNRRQNFHRAINLTKENVKAAQKNPEQEKRTNLGSKGSSSKKIAGISKRGKEKRRKKKKKKKKKKKTSSSLPGCHSGDVSAILATPTPPQQKKT